MDTQPGGGFVACLLYLDVFNACRTRERTYPMNMKGKANMPAANARVAISNMPVSTPFLVSWVLLWKHLSLLRDIKGVENCS